MKHLGSKVERPTEELRGFERINLRPKEKRTVELVLPAKELAYWNTEQHAFVVEGEAVSLMIGASSENILLKKTVRVVP